MGKTRNPFLPPCGVRSLKEVRPPPLGLIAKLLRLGLLIEVGNTCPLLMGKYSFDHAHPQPLLGYLIIIELSCVYPRNNISSHELHASYPRSIYLTSAHIVRLNRAT